MKKYNETEEQLGNIDDEPQVAYNSKLDKASQLIYERLEQLNREVGQEHSTPKVKEYHHVRIDKLQTLLRIFELKK